MVSHSVYGFGGQSGLLTVLSGPPFARKYKEEETMINEVWTHTLTTCYMTVTMWLQASTLLPKPC